MRMILLLSVLSVGFSAQAVEVYRCSPQQLKGSKTSVSLKAIPDSKHLDYFMVDGKKTTVLLEALNAKMKDGMPKLSQ